ncbi:MAG: GGDEF domain-containing protein [Nitrospirae bacterium]|nr:GGDEF domain-containing protein [Nitrospirota bacterium]
MYKRIELAMLGPFRTKIGQRLMIAFLALALAPLMGATWFAVERGQVEIRRQTLAMLRTAADGAEAQLRETDFVARYGGEEFIVLLPETSKANALEVAEKIRIAVETQLDGRLTVSLGVAAFPDDATEAHALTQKADQALYRAKNTGRNRVCGAGKA